MYVCVNMTLCYYILFLAMYIAVLSTATTDEQCFPVQECGDIPALPFDRLSYSVAINQWHHTYSRICPRSDSSVPHWDITFVDAGPLAGSYCIKGKNFSSSDVCAKNDATTLTFLNLTSFQNTTQSLDIVFNGTDFLAEFPLEIAPTGVTAVPSAVYISSGDDSIHLTWYVHSAQEVKSFEIKHKGMVVADQSTITSDQSICFLSTDGEITEVFTMEILNPTESSTGEYTFLMGSSYSDVVTVELDSSYFIEPTPSAMLSSSPTATAVSVSPQLTVSSVTVESSHPIQSDTTKQYTSSALSQESSSSSNVNTNTMSPSTDSSVGANYSVLWIVISAAAAVVSVVLLACVTVVGILCWTKRHDKRNDVRYRQDGGEMSNYSSSSSTFRMKKTSVVGPYNIPDGPQSPPEETVTHEPLATDNDLELADRITDIIIDEISKNVGTKIEKLGQDLQSSAEAREERMMGKLNEMESKTEENFVESKELQRDTLGIMETTFTTVVDSDKQEEEDIHTTEEVMMDDNDSHKKLQESDDSGTGEDLCSSDEQNN